MEQLHLNAYQVRELEYAILLEQGVSVRIVRQALHCPKCPLLCFFDFLDCLCSQGRAPHWQRVPQMGLKKSPVYHDFQMPWQPIPLLV